MADKKNSSKRPAYGHWHLSRQILAIVVIVTALSVLAVGEAVRLTEARQVEEELKERTRQTVDLISAVTVDALIDPPPLNWSTAYDRKRRITDGNETTQTGRDCLEATTG